MGKLSPGKTSTPQEKKEYGGTIRYHVKHRGNIHSDNNTFGDESPMNLQGWDSDENDSDEYDEEYEQQESNENNARIVYTNNKYVPVHHTSAQSERTDTSTQESERKYTLTRILPFVSIFVILIAAVMFCYFTRRVGLISNGESVPLSDEKFTHLLHELQIKYDKIKPIVFEELESAVKLINQNGRPLSFVFAFRNEEIRKVAEEMSSDVANVAAQYLGNGSVLTIKPDSWDPDVKADFGPLLTRWRPEIEQGRVMFVPSLQRVPSHLALVFHVLCDEESPYVRRSLYLHTVDLGNDAPQTDRQSNKSGRGSFTAVEKRLRQSWASMSSEKFDPLLTRIAGSVHILD